MLPRVKLFVSVDVEEDNWRPARSGVTIENIRELPRLESFFQRLGIKATYFTTHQVAKVGWAGEILREIHEGGHSEIGGHLHPWNTPPLEEKFVPRSTMVKNLPYELQVAKLENLTESLSAAVGAAPISFRAGRYGMSSETLRALLHCGYRVDSSVTPFTNWGETDDGPQFEKAPLGCYFFDGSADVQAPADAGSLLEVPMSFGYSRRPFWFWCRIHRILALGALKPIRPLGVAARLGIVKKLALAPELTPVSDMLLLSRNLVASGIAHLHLFFHSPSLRPGLTPYVTSAAEVDEFYASIESYLEALSGVAQIESLTLADASARMNGKRQPAARV